MAKAEKPDTQIVRRSIEANGRGLALRSMDDMYRFSQYVAASGLAPRSFDTPEKVMIAVQSGAEMGMTPMRSLGSICVINGQARLYGDAPLALVRQSGLMESIVETLEGEGDDLTAVCVVKRREDPESITRRFSVKDAMLAKLWAKSGPWSMYPKRMLQMRARSLALRDVFPDCFAGATIAEEYAGVEDEETAPKSAALLTEDKPTKQVDSTQEDMENMTEGWTPEDLPVDLPPEKTKKQKKAKETVTEADVPDANAGDERKPDKPGWHCNSCGKDFYVPLNGEQCSKCLRKDCFEKIEEPKDETHKEETENSV